MATLMADPCAPKVSFGTTSPRIIRDLPLGASLRPKMKTPDQLQSSFQTRLNDYNEACEPSMIKDCEDKLCISIGNLSTYICYFPLLYPQIVKLKAIQSMIELLKDDNCGIRLATKILSEFRQLTLVDVFVEDQEEQATAFVESVSGAALDVFVFALGKFSEDEDVVFLAVQNIAQMIFLVPSLAETVAANTQLINWVSKALGAPRWDFPKKHAVGLLDTLLVSSMENRLLLGAKGFVTLVVNALSSLSRQYEEEEEEDGEEEEEDGAEELRLDEEDYLLGTLFRSLLLLLEASENKERFANAGGVQLMIKIIQNEDLSYGYCGTAIEALDIAVKDCQSASDKFANHALGLDIAFSASMDDKIPPSFTHEKEEIKEHLISLIASLTGGTAKTKNNVLLNKFAENGCEKITWLVELFVRYLKQVEPRMNCLENKQLDQSELYKEKLQYGLSTLQSIAVILGYLWSSKNHKMIGDRMSRHNSEKKHVLDVLSAYRDHTGNAVESSANKTAIDEYIDSLEENPDQWMVQDAEIKRQEIVTDDDSLEENPENPYQWMEHDAEIKRQEIVIDDDSLEESPENPYQWMEQGAEIKRREIVIDDDSLEENPDQWMEQGVEVKRPRI